MAANLRGFRFFKFISTIHWRIGFWNCISALAVADKKKRNKKTETKNRIFTNWGKEAFDLIFQISPISAKLDAIRATSMEINAVSARKFVNFCIVDRSLICGYVISHFILYTSSGWQQAVRFHVDHYVDMVITNAKFNQKN